MRVVIDVEANGLFDYTTVWCVVARDVDTSKEYVFVKPTRGDSRLREFHNSVTEYIGHNLLGFDVGCMRNLLGIDMQEKKITDTLILSKLLKSSIDGGHSLEAWGDRLNFPKKHLNVDFSTYSDDILDRCRNDVALNLKLFVFLNSKLDRPEFKDAIRVEHEIASVCEGMTSDGFAFDVKAATALLDELNAIIGPLEEELKTAFPRKSKLVKEITPRLTKYGTISKANLPRDWTDLSSLSADCPFSLVEWVDFNPGSPIQVTERLHEAGWKPVDKTSGHVEAEKTEDEEKLAKFAIHGWKINEKNLSTLPDTAPEAAYKLVRWLLLAGRVRSLKEWLACVRPSDRRIHGSFSGIGTWTHRMSHSNPNMGNIATAKSIKYKAPELQEMATNLGARMRALWIASDGYTLVGTDAASIQLRIFAHYINEKVFTEALISGKSKDGTDVHSLNASILGCSRDTAKTFIYAFLLGAGDKKLGEILGGGQRLGYQAKQRFIEAYPGLARLRRTNIPKDASRGYFESLDKRLVVCESKHLMMAGYLQTGEAVIMKHANILWRKRAKEAGLQFRQLNFIHDEWQTEVLGGEEEAKLLGKIQCDAIAEVGEMFNLNCPMAGETRYGRNWYDTH